MIARLAAVVPLLACAGPAYTYVETPHRPVARPAPAPARPAHVHVDVHFWGEHPVPVEQGGGWCGHEGPHRHPYEPPHHEHFVRRNDHWHFGADIEWHYDFGHPVPTAFGGGWCSVAGTHVHRYRPWRDFRFETRRRVFVFTGTHPAPHARPEPRPRLTRPVTIEPGPAPRRPEAAPAHPRSRSGEGSFTVIPTDPPPKGKGVVRVEPNASRPAPRRPLPSSGETGARQDAGTSTDVITPSGTVVRTRTRGPRLPPAEPQVRPPPRDSAPRVQATPWQPPREVNAPRPHAEPEVRPPPAPPRVRPERPSRSYGAQTPVAPTAVPSREPRRSSDRGASTASPGAGRPTRAPAVRELPTIDRSPEAGSAPVARPRPSRSRAD